MGGTPSCQRPQTCEWGSLSQQQGNSRPGGAWGLQPPGLHFQSDGGALAGERAEEVGGPLGWTEPHGLGRREGGRGDAGWVQVEASKAWAASHRVGGSSGGAGAVGRVEGLTRVQAGLRPTGSSMAREPRTRSGFSALCAEPLSCLPLGGHFPLEAIQCHPVFWVFLWLLHRPKGPF